MIDDGEDCEPSPLDLDGKQCSDMIVPGDWPFLPTDGTGKFNGGTLGCGDDCLFDISGCTLCGDGIKNGTEFCDDYDVGAATCWTEFGTSGTLRCSGDCASYDSNSCHTTECGDPEYCDLENYPERCASCSDCHPCCGDGICCRTCAGEDYEDDTICPEDCQVCGDGFVTVLPGTNPPYEQCDWRSGVGYLEFIFGPGIIDCSDVTHPLYSFLYYTGGELECNFFFPNACKYDVSGCYLCGDGNCERLKGESYDDCPGECPSCGDGRINGTDQCDRMPDGTLVFNPALPLNICDGAGCNECLDYWVIPGFQFLGHFNGGVLGCNADCTVDKTGCTYCHDGECNDNETDVTCAADCISCGDGVINGTELCDPGNPPAVPQNMNGHTCADVGLPADGAISCTSACQPYYENCRDWVCGESGFDCSIFENCRDCPACTNDPGEGCCGDNVLDPGEYCDRSQLNSKTCLDFGTTYGRYETGTLTCTSECTFDTSACRYWQCGESEYNCLDWVKCRNCLDHCDCCGDGVVDSYIGEQCDPGDLVGELPNFSGGTCTNNCGTLICTEDCQIDRSNCCRCGDGIIQEEMGEQCDDGECFSYMCNGEGNQCDSNCQVDCDNLRVDTRTSIRLSSACGAECPPGTNAWCYPDEQCWVTVIKDSTSPIAAICPNTYRCFLEDRCEDCGDYTCWRWGYPFEVCGLAGTGELQCPIDCCCILSNGFPGTCCGALGQTECQPLAGENCLSCPQDCGGSPCITRSWTTGWYVPIQCPPCD